jgi:hypothetical protein
MLQRDVRGAVRYLTDRGKGGILLLDDVNEKSGDTIMEALESKHPNAWILDVDSLPNYTITPTTLLMSIFVRNPSNKLLDDSHEVWG